MRRDVAEQMARATLQLHELHGWIVVWTRSRRTFGYCNARTRTIGLSGPLVDLNDEGEVLDTIRHEVTHALAPGDGHGRKWRAACRTTGARPERCYDSAKVAIPPSAWVGECAVGHVARRARKPKKVIACRACCVAAHGRAAFDRRFAFAWRRDLSVAPGIESAANAEIVAVVKLRREGKSYREIERAMGWPAGNGTRAFNIVKAFERALAAHGGSE